MILGWSQIVTTPYLFTNVNEGKFTVTPFIQGEGPDEVYALYNSITVISGEIPIRPGYPKKPNPRFT